jgi:hypothetical protein
MTDWTTMVTLTSWKLVMKRYQAMKLLPILWLTEVYTLQIADMLPSKTVPEVNNAKKHWQTWTLRPKPKVKVTATAPPKKKARACLVEVEEIEDEDNACNITAKNSNISPTSSFQIPDTKKVSHQVVYYIVDIFIQSGFSEEHWLKLEKEPNL